jgi:hypothetical protein
MGRAIAVVAVIFLVVPAAAADGLGDGLAAYDRGDYRSALEAWKGAAATGNVAAMNAIAGLYAQGEGVRRDPSVAAAWYRRSAERGNPIGQLNLGDMHGRGAGVPRDRGEAYFWLSLAAAQGNAWSAERKKEIARTMTAAEIAAAQSRIETWRPKKDPDSKR